MIDLIGKQFGELIAHTCVRKNSRDYWECKCSCGNQTMVRWDHLTKGNTKSCGCLHRRNGNKSPFFKGYGEISLDFFNHIKRASLKPQKYRNVKTFDVTIEYVWQLYLGQNRRCALTKRDIAFTERTGSRSRRCSASLDRIDSTKGYIIGNVQWVHKDVNVMKNDFPQSYFVEICREIAKNNP